MTWLVLVAAPAAVAVPLDYAVASGGALPEYRLMPLLGSDQKGFAVRFIPD